MTPRWHDGALAALSPGAEPTVWSITAGDPAADQALAAARATADDLADAARRADGSHRLRRRRLARALIARLAGMHADAVRLSRSAFGAPVVVSPGGWHVGLSGRGSDCLIGAARRPIAVDREPLDDAPPLRDMLTAAEAWALDRLPAAEQPGAWLHRWTMKETHAKLIGEPLRIRPETIETRIDSAGRATAAFEGVSRCWTRRTAKAIETVALWQ